MFEQISLLLGLPNIFLRFFEKNELFIEKNTSITH